LGTAFGVSKKKIRLMEEQICEFRRAYSPSKCGIKCYSYFLLIFYENTGKRLEEDPAYPKGFPLGMSGGSEEN
jgi:hypothetical protein